MMARCSEPGQVFLARRLAALLREPSRRTVERHMLFVHDAGAWREDIVDLLVAKVTQPTELTVVKIEELQAFVARVYEAAERAPGSTSSES